MQIKWTTLSTDFNGETCFTHARGLIMPDGFGLMTAQPLRLTGCDVFYGMYISFTYDGGKTWSKLTPSKTLLRRDMGDGYEIAMCDATPMYHEKTGKILLMGHSVMYLNDNMAPPPSPRYTVYAVYEPEKKDFTPFKILEMPETEKQTYFNCGNGCGQNLELLNGELLVPVYYMDKEQAESPWTSCTSVSVVRCSFDGQTVRFIEIGNEFKIDVPRGLGEPSIVKYKGDYLLALRNDQSGYVSKGDGLNFSPATQLTFDDGTNVGNYCTQQHWITGGGKLYMVYTRKGVNNDHVFRHRAPLLIAEFDTERMCLIRSTEKIAVPERGARLGNFGCQSFLDGKRAFVFASEWMQTIEPNPSDWTICAKYGSDNSVFISEIVFDE